MSSPPAVAMAKVPKPPGQEEPEHRRGHHRRRAVPGHHRQTEQHPTEQRGAVPPFGVIDALDGPHEEGNRERLGHGSTAEPHHRGVEGDEPQAPPRQDPADPTAREPPHRPEHRGVEDILGHLEHHAAPPHVVDADRRRGPEEPREEDGHRLVAEPDLPLPGLDAEAEGVLQGRLERLEDLIGVQAAEKEDRVEGRRKRRGEHLQPRSERTLCETHLACEAHSASG